MPAVTFILIYKVSFFLRIFEMFTKKIPPTLPQSHTALAFWVFLGSHGSHFVGGFVAHTDPTLSLHRELAKPNNYPKNNLK